MYPKDIRKGQHHCHPQQIISLKTILPCNSTYTKEKPNLDGNPNSKTKALSMKKPIKFPDLALS